MLPFRVCDQFRDKFLGGADFLGVWGADCLGVSLQEGVFLLEVVWVPILVRGIMKMAETGLLSHTRCCSQFVWV